MSAETDNNQARLLRSTPQFEHINGLANQIGVQNSIYAELVDSGAITIESFQDLAHDYLLREQQTTFDELVSAGDAAPYEEIAKANLALEAALGEVAAKLAAIEIRQTAEAEKIHREQELLAGRLPGLAPQLSELAKLLKERLIDKTKQSLEAERAEIEGQQAAMAAVYEAASSAWPIPRLIETKRPVPEAEPEVVIVDDFPEQGHKPTKEQVVEKVRRKYPYDVLRGASEFVSLLLAEEPKYIYSQEELAEITYGSSTNMYRTRVSALVSNFELGKVQIIGRILQENGLVLQRGERTRRHKNTGEKFGIARPVYRAVPIAETDCRERVVHSDTDITWVYDGWHTVIFDSSKPVISEEISTEDLEELQSRSGEVVAEPPESRLAEVVEPEPVKLPQSGPVEILQSRAESSKPKQKREPAWVVEFRADLMETIARFEADGLMLEGEVGWQLLRIKSSSRIMGTETMAERAVHNGIISKAESALDSTLPVTKFICMALQNQHQAHFTDRRRRKIVTQIVDEVVGKQLEEVKKQSPN